MRFPALQLGRIALCGLMLSVLSESDLLAQFAPVQQPAGQAVQQQPTQQPPRQPSRYQQVPQQPAAPRQVPLGYDQPQYAPANQGANPAANQGAQPLRVAQLPPAGGQPGQPRSAYAPPSNIQVPVGYEVKQGQLPEGVQIRPGLPPAMQFAPNNPNAPQQVQQQVPVRARFQLNQEQVDQLHRVLDLWEAESDKVKNFACPFERWEYDPVFGPGPNVPKTKGYGDLKYVKPDKGHFHVKKLTHYTPPANPNDPNAQPTYAEKPNEFGEHWVCDGKAVYEYKFDVKQLVVYELPEEMRGKAIADGPLPFLFGAKKVNLLARYDMQVTIETATEIWLDAWPLRQEDAANYQHVELILNRDQMLPKALQVYLPNGKTRMVYIFQKATVNSTLNSILDWFKQPSTPFGWKKVIEKAPAADPQKQAMQPGGGQQR